MSYDREQLFNMVQTRMESAGNRVRRIANCVATGSECSATDRVMLIGTASFIFISLMVLAGSSIGIAARSKVVENAKKEQQQKLQGWGPQAMAQRLNNMIGSGKNTFMSLKQGIISGQLTKSQRNFLVGLGASIIGAALVLAAVLTGMAVYAKQQEDKRGIDEFMSEMEAELAEEKALGEMAKRKADIEQTEEDILNIGVADDASQYRVKGTGQELQFDTNIGPDTPKNKFIAFFNTKFQLAKDNAKQLKAAMAETISKGKNKVFKSTKEAGNFFLQKVGLADLKSDLSDFSIKDMVQKLLGIDLGNFFTGMRQVVSQVAETKTSLNLALANIQSIRELERKFEKLKDYIENTVKNSVEFLMEAQKHNKVWFAFALPKAFKSKESLESEAQKDKDKKKWQTTWKIRDNLRVVLNMYPEIVRMVNQELNLPFIGEIVEKIINVTVGGALNVAILTNQVGGKLGKITSADDMLPLLREMKDHTKSLAGNVKQALSNKVFLVEEPSTKETLSAIVKNLSKNGISIARTFMNEVQPILEQVEIVQPQIKSVQRRLDKYIEQVSDAVETIKAAAREVRKNPLQAIPRFPRIIRDNVATVAGLTKGTLNSTIRHASQMLTDLKINELLPRAMIAFDSFNKLLSVKVEGKKTSLINPAFIDEIRKIIFFNYVNINEAVRKMKSIMDKTPTIRTSSAPAA